MKTDFNLRTPSGQNNVAYGYNSYGSFVTYRTPTNGQASLQIEYPQKQLSPMVYVVAKGNAQPPMPVQNRIYNEGEGGSGGSAGGDGSVASSE